MKVYVLHECVDSSDFYAEDSVIMVTTDKCMCYTVDVDDDFESILSVEEQAEKMARSEYPNLKNFETLYIKELPNR